MRATTELRQAAEAEKPSVLMLGKYFPPAQGGLEQFAFSLAEAICHDVRLTVLVHGENRRSSTQQGPYTVVRAGTWFRLASHPISPGIFMHLRRNRYDIIHVHAPNVLGVLATLLYGGPARVVVTHHADMVGFGVIGFIARRLYAKLLRRARVLTMLSLRNRRVARDIRSTDVPLAALPVGLEAAQFAAQPATKARAEALRAQLPEDHCVFVFVGRLVPYKGLDVLIDALAHVPRAICLIAGDGPERERLEARAARRSISHRVLFLGAVSDAEKLAALHTGDAFVLPSVSVAETFGIVQVEAQLCALPVVTTDLPTAVTEVTVAGVTGLVVPPRDVGALARALTLLRDDPKARADLGAAGRQRALATYSREAARRAALAIYATALRSDAADEGRAAVAKPHPSLERAAL